MKHSAAFVSAVTAVAASQPPAYKGQGSLSFSASINIDASKHYQTMVGGGCSGAFGAACTTNTLSAADQQNVVETLFGENAGGLSILRNIVASSRGSTILPVCPATPSSPVNYTSLAAINNDGCQLTLAQNALKFNPDLYLYADAWSAPGCFKSSGQEAGAGVICGVRGVRTNATNRVCHYANVVVVSQISPKVHHTAWSCQFMTSLTSDPAFPTYCPKPSIHANDPKVATVAWIGARPMRTI
jgi:glucosylceramidase